MSPQQTIAHYRITAKLGEGGMGEVWRATDMKLGRDVALKIPPASFASDASRIARFEREAKTLASLNHPHIAQIYGVEEGALVMELVEGEPLKGPLPVEKAVEYAGQILDALDAAHRKGIVHRDLKPGNILVTRQGVKLLDFGLAKLRQAPLAESDETVEQGPTQHGQIVGTLQYMSPEQLQGKEVDARSDLFSFGCVLYEMLTGKPAFAGQSAASVIAAILERDPAPPKAAPPLERVVRSSLAKDPDQRFQTARDLKAALNWAMEPPTPAAAAKRSRMWRWMAIAALVIGFGGGWAVSHLRHPVTEDRVFRLQIDLPENGQFTFGPVVGGIALSPDGRTAAYVASSNGKTGLWVRPLDGATARLLAGTEEAAYPFWSPDSKSLAFSTLGRLKRVDLAGGSPSIICRATGLALGGAWTSDGHIVFGTLSSGLWQVAATGGAPVPLTTLDTSRGENTHRWPQTLPGGRFLYQVLSGKPETSGIYAASFARPAERIRLLPAETNVVYAPGGDGKDYLLWLRGGALIAQEFSPSTLQFAGEPRLVAEPVTSIGSLGSANVAASAGGVLLYGASNAMSQFTWFDRAGKPAGVVGEPGEYSSGLRLSPDVRRVVTARDRSGGSDLWLLEVERLGARRLALNSSYSAWSPDGRSIVFSSGFPRNLFRADSTGAGDVQRIAQSSGNQYVEDWSRDGHWFLYAELTPEYGWDLWAIAMTAEGRLAPVATPKLFLRTPFYKGSGRFSPESPPRWVAYQSDSTGRNEVYIQAFPEPRGIFQISTGGGRFPQWGAGGHELFYVSPENKLMVVNLKLGVDSVEPSNPRELFPLPITDTGLSPYEATRDGQRFLVRAAPGHAGQPLTVIVNWPWLLKKDGAAR
jgi:serine/threonine protein kinase